MSPGLRRPRQYAACERLTLTAAQFAKSSREFQLLRCSAKRLPGQNTAVCTPFPFRNWLAGSERGAYTDVQGHSMDWLGTFPEFVNDELSISRHDSAVG
jgi:hypothetical protein